MEIRTVQSRSDVRGLVQAHGRAWQAAYDEILSDEALSAVTVEPTEDDIDQWMDGIEANREGVFVAVEDETVCGFIDMRWGDVKTKSFVGENEAGLKAIYVHPDHWGEGVGTALLERALRALPDWVTAIRLDVFADNDAARGFYESRGFEQCGHNSHEIAGQSYPATVYVRKL